MKFPIGIQDFKSIIKDGYLYIDKTDLVYQLVKGGKTYFLSRPRRFGKSLLVSTLEYYFKGERELFIHVNQIGKTYESLQKRHFEKNGSDNHRRCHFRFATLSLTARVQASALLWPSKGWVALRSE